MRLRDVSAKPLDGCLRLEGELTVFVIYSPEDESMPVQWLEEAIPFFRRYGDERCQGRTDSYGDSAAGAQGY